MADASKVKATAANNLPPNAGKGRKRGVPNKVTREVREVIAEFARAKAGEFEGWINRVAATDPARAAELYLRALEYHIPKLGKMEHTIGRQTWAELVEASGAQRPTEHRPALDAQPSPQAPSTYSVRLEATPLPLPRTTHAHARETSAPKILTPPADPPGTPPPRASDLLPPTAENPNREGLADGERTVADLRRRAAQGLFSPGYDPYAN